MNFCNENLTILSTRTDREFFDVNQALRSIDLYGSRDTVRTIEQREEIRYLRFRVAELERKQASQACINHTVTRYTKELHTSIIKLTRSFFRLNNKVELDKPNLTLLNEHESITASNIRTID